MEIESKYGKTGATDSAAVQEANEIAIELAQYDGLMAEVFEIVGVALQAATEADSTGQSIEEIEDEFKSTIGTSPLTGAHCPSCKSYGDCSQNCEDEKRSDDMWSAGGAFADAARCVVGGAMGFAAAAGPIGVVIAAIGKSVCVGEMVHDLYKDMKANKTAHELCMVDCKERFPKLDEA